MQTPDDSPRAGGDESARELARGLVRDFRRTWPQLAVTDVLAKIAGFLLLTPLLALLLRLFVGAGDGGVLVDTQILYFFLRPAGLALVVLAGAAWAGIAFAGLASLMTIGFGALHDRRVSYLDALRHAAHRAPVLARLGGQLIARALLLAAPFLALAGGAYLLLLTKHDINYYLTDRPREFWIAALLIGALLTVLAILLVRFAVRWSLALPIVLFERQGPRAALRASVAATEGHRRAIGLWFVGWGLATTAVSSVATALVGLADRLFIPTEDASLASAAVGVGASLAVLGVVNTVVSLVSASWLGLLVVRVYSRYAGPGELEGGKFGAPGSLGERAEWRFPRRGLLWGSLAAALLAGAVAFGLVRSIRVERHVEIAAHRGGAALRPENTLAAIEHAISVGTDWVEIDVQEGSDGVVTVLHDQDFLRVAGVATKIWDASHQQVQQIDIGSHFAPEYADQRAPTLAQVLETCKDRTKVIIELKYYGHDQRLEERVVELVEAAGMSEQVQIMSLAEPLLRKTRELRPDWTYGLLVAVAVGDLSRVDYDFMAVRAPLARHTLIRRAHRRGKRVFAWTVDDAVQMSAMISRGVDVLITDQPARARAVIAQHAELNTVERLLLAAGVRFGLLDDELEETPPDDA